MDINVTLSSPISSSVTDIFKNTTDFPLSTISGFSTLTDENVTDNEVSVTQATTSTLLSTDVTQSKLYVLSSTDSIVTSLVNVSQTLETVVENVTNLSSTSIFNNSTEIYPGNSTVLNVSNPTDKITSSIHKEYSTSGLVFGGNSTLRFDDSSYFTTYEEYSDDITIVIGILVPLVVVALLVAAFVCYAKYWKKRDFKKRRKDRVKVSFSDNPVVTGSVLAPRYSDSEECNTNVFAELPDKQDGFVTIDLSDGRQESNGGINNTVKETELKTDIGNQNLESICEKDELCMSDEEHHDEKGDKSATNKTSSEEIKEDTDQTTVDTKKEELPVFNDNGMLESGVHSHMPDENHQHIPCDEYNEGTSEVEENTKF